jgi:hypothetical protein
MSRTPPPSQSEHKRFLPQFVFFSGLAFASHELIASAILFAVPSANSVRLAMQVFVSVLLLSATLYVVLSKKYDAKDKHWAYTTIGLILGFWLKQ